MKPLSVLFAFLFLSGTVAFTQDTVREKSLEKRPFSIGESFSFHSEILNETRTVNIYLPPQFHPDSAQQYNVIYLLDGSAEEDFVHIAGLVSFLNFPWARSMPDAIIVGISNVDRKRDFTYPTTVKEDKDAFPTTGGSAAFIHFLEKELKPLIESQYPVDTVSTLLGQSLGGLLATEILFKNPTLFTNYIIVSPSLWWDNESLLKQKLSTIGTEGSIYIGVGKEGEVMEQVARELIKKLHKINTDSPRNHLYFDYLEEEDHSNVLHRAAYNAFRKIHDVATLAEE